MLANPRSGTAQRNPGVIDRAMAALGPRATLRSFSGDPTHEAEAAVRDGFSIIVAAGGDGTVAGVAHALAGTGAAMAVLPMGTFNYFARGLKMPETPEEAARAILDGRPHAIRVGTLNGRVFLNNVSIGLYPAILEEREAAYARFGRSRLLAHLASLRTLLRLQRRHDLRLDLDGKVMAARSPMVFIARSAYQLDQFGLQGAAAISDDRFALFLAPETSRLGLLRLAWKLIRRRVDHARDITVATPARITLSKRGRRRVSVALDGEKMKMPLPLRIALADDRLRVILPPQNTLSAAKAGRDAHPAPVGPAFRGAGRGCRRRPSGACARAGARCHRDLGRSDAARRRGQFAAARAYAAAAPAVLAVPGNHDIPLYNLVRRLSRPLGGYVRAFGAEVEPALDLPGVVVQGVNTADPLVWKAGRLRAASVARLTARFAAAPAGVWRVAVLHHAPVPAADGTPADMADPAGALSALARAGAQVVLSGHTHMPHAAPRPASRGC